MVRLPSSQDITRQQPSAQRGVVSISPSPVGQQIGRAGQVVSGIAENMQANKIKEQLAYAESDFLTKQIDIENQLADDPDFDTYEARYNEAMKQAVQSSTEIVSDPQVRALLQSKIAPNIARGRGRIMSLARDKKANYTVAQTNAVMDNNIRNIRSTSNPTLQSQAMNQALARIDADLENGYITPIQAQAKKEKFLQDSSTAKFESSSPEEQMSAIKYLSGSKSQGGFDVAHDIVMQNEGGYTPVDGASGAPALYGVNRKWHPEVFDEIKALYDSGNEAEAQLVAKQFYRDEFWNRYKIDELEPVQQIVVMDGVVNHHIGFSRKLVEAAKEGASSQELIAMRKREYDRLGQSPDYEASHDGWMNRLQRVSKATGDAYGYIKYVPQSKVNSIAAELEKNAIDLQKRARVSAAISGEDFIDSSDSDQMKIFNEYVRNDLLPQVSGLPPEQRNSIIVQQISNAGIVPKSLKADIVGKLRTGSNEDVIASADLFLRLQEQSPQMVRDFKEKDIQLAVNVANDLASGIPAEKAIQYARSDLEIENKPQFDLHKSQLKEDKIKNDINNKAEKSLEFGFLQIGPSVDISSGIGASIYSDYKNAYERNFLQTGDTEKADAFARTIVQGKYAESNFNNGVIMKYAPESYYSIYGNDDNEWMMKQFEDYILSQDRLEKYDPEKWKIFADRETERTASIGQPTYAIMHKQPDGSWISFDKRWMPDKQYEMNARISRAREKREKSLLKEKTNDYIKAKIGSMP